MSYHVYYRGGSTISPALNEADAAVLGAFLQGKKNELYDGLIQALEPTEPLWSTGMLTISDDHAHLYPDEDESRPGLYVWLGLIQKYFLTPKGYLLNGEIAWEAEEPTDRGVIFAKDNIIEMVDDQILNPGPSWARVSYASPDVVEAIREPGESADDTGCSPDLTVVASEPLASLRASLL